VGGHGGGRGQKSTPRPDGHTFTGLFPSVIFTRMVSISIDGQGKGTLTFNRENCGERKLPSGEVLQPPQKFHRDEGNRTLCRGGARATCAKKKRRKKEAIGFNKLEGEKNEKKLDLSEHNLKLKGLRGLRKDLRQVKRHVQELDHHTSAGARSWG